MDEINLKISKIHNYIYANDGLSNSETLNEFLKLFYCKIIDEENEDNLSKIDNNELLLLEIENLFSVLKKRLFGLIDSKEKINLKKETVLFVIRELKDIKLKDVQFDLKGHILQKIIDRSYRESKGQFFTPSPVVDFIVKMINPQKNELGCDPASGTGGFMFAALEYISNHQKIEANDVKNVYFYDISKNLIKLIAMRMMFEFSNCNTNLFVKDSISEEIEDKFDYVITNPPFGTQGKISTQSILSKYELGRDEGGFVLKSQVPDILFVEKVIKILKNGGRAAVVLPDGDFENPSLKYFRKFLTENVRIDAIVALPDGTFIPYGTGVKSSIIFFTKFQKQQIKEFVVAGYNIFYGKITKLGYTFSKHSKDIFKDDGTADEDYSDVLDSFKNKKNTDFCYTVKISEIIANDFILSEHFYSPVYNKAINFIKKQDFKPLKELVEFKYLKEKIIDDEYYDYIEIADLNAYTNEIINSTKLLGEDMPSRASYKLEINDIIVATAGGSIGTPKQAKAIVTENYEGCICTNGFSVMKAKSISAYYLLSFFNSELFYKQILKYKYGTAIPCISREDFENILVPIPEKSVLMKKENNIKEAIRLREEAMRLMFA